MQRMKSEHVLLNWLNYHKGQAALHHSSQDRWIALEKLLVERDVARAAAVQMAGKILKHDRLCLDNAAWLSQAHGLCTKLGVKQGHIEDRLFEAIGKVMK